MLTSICRSVVRVAFVLLAWGGLTAAIQAQPPGQISPYYLQLLSQYSHPTQPSGIFAPNGVCPPLLSGYGGQYNPYGTGYSYGGAYNPYATTYGYGMQYYPYSTGYGSGGTYNPYGTGYGYGGTYNPYGTGFGYGSTYNPYGTGYGGYQGTGSGYGSYGTTSGFGPPPAPAWLLNSPGYISPPVGFARPWGQQ